MPFRPFLARRPHMDRLAKVGRVPAPLSQPFHTTALVPPERSPPSLTGSRNPSLQCDGLQSPKGSRDSPARYGRIPARQCFLSENLTPARFRPVAVFAPLANGQSDPARGR